MWKQGCVPLSPLTARETEERENEPVIGWLFEKDMKSGDALSFQL